MRSTPHFDDVDAPSTQHDGEVPSQQRDQQPHRGTSGSYAPSRTYAVGDAAQPIAPYEPLSPECSFLPGACNPTKSESLSSVGSAGRDDPPQTEPDKAKSEPKKVKRITIISRHIYSVIDGWHSLIMIEYDDGTIRYLELLRVDNGKPGHWVDIVDSGIKVPDAYLKALLNGKENLDLKPSSDLNLTQMAEKLVAAEKAFEQVQDRIEYSYVGAVTGLTNTVRYDDRSGALIGGVFNSNSFVQNLLGFAGLTDAVAQFIAWTPEHSDKRPAKGGTVTFTHNDYMPGKDITVNREWVGEISHDESGAGYYRHYTSTGVTRSRSGW